MRDEKSAGIRRGLVDDLGDPSVLLHHAQRERHDAAPATDNTQETDHDHPELPIL